VEQVANNYLREATFRLKQVKQATFASDSVPTSSYIPSLPTVTAIHHQSTSHHQYESCRIGIASGAGHFCRRTGDNEGGFSEAAA
jgi:hypothetical protein